MSLPTKWQQGLSNSGSKPERTTVLEDQVPPRAVPQNYGLWMSNAAAKIGPKPLRQVAMPGTHDSCTDRITSSSKIGVDTPEWAKVIDKLPGGKEIQKEIMAKWGRAQQLSVTGQLEAGIRYLDLRLQNSNGDRDQEFTHGLVSGPLHDMLAQVQTYLTAPGNDKEILILDFNHLLGFTTPNAHQAVTSQLQRALGNKLAPASLGLDVTVNQLWASTYRIITFYDHAPTVSVTPFLWPAEKISSPWPNTTDPTTLFAKLDSEVAGLPAPTFFVLQGVLTPDETTIVNGLNPVDRGPDSLQALSKRTNPALVKRLQNGWKGKGINIVICDWFDLTAGYIDAVVNLNI